MTKKRRSKKQKAADRRRPGRPAKPEAERRRETVRLSLTREELRRLDEAAKRLGGARAETARKILCAGLDTLEAADYDFR